VHGEEVAGEGDAEEGGEDADAACDAEDILETLGEEASDEDGGDEEREDEQDADGAEGGNGGGGCEDHQQVIKERGGETDGLRKAAVKGCCLPLFEEKRDAGEVDACGPKDDAQIIKVECIDIAHDCFGADVRIAGKGGDEHDAQCKKGGEDESCTCIFFDVKERGEALGE